MNRSEQFNSSEDLQINTQFNNSIAEVSMQEAVNQMSINMPDNLQGEYKIEFRSMDIPYVPLAVHNYIAVVDPEGKDIVQIHGMSHDSNGFGSINFMDNQDRLHIMTITPNDNDLHRTVFNMHAYENGYSLFDMNEAQFNEVKELLIETEQTKNDAIKEISEDTVQSTVIKTGNAAEIASTMKAMYGLAHAMNNKDMAYISEPWEDNQNSNSVASTIAYAVTGQDPNNLGIYNGLTSPGKNRQLLSDEEIKEINDIIINQHKMPLNIFQKNVEDLVTGKISYELHELNSDIMATTHPTDGNIISNDGKIVTGSNEPNQRSTQLSTIKTVIEGDDARYNTMHKIEYTVDGETFNAPEDNKISSYEADKLDTAQLTL